MKNIPLLIFLIAVVLLFSWQWKKSRKLHKDFLNLPDNERKDAESKLYLDPVKNAYVRAQPKWLIVISIVGILLLFVLIGLQKSGIIR